VSLLVCALLAAARPPIVEGRIGEPGGPGASFALVTLAQGDRMQTVRTGADGGFRFRAFEGDGTVTVRLPQGWTSAGALSRSVGPALRGDVIRADFEAAARRILRGRLLVAGWPLPGVDLRAGRASGHTDAQGLFMLDGLAAGVVEVRVDAPPLSGRVEVPAGPSELSRDVSVSVPEFGALHLSRLPQAGAARPIADWLAPRPMSRTEVAAIEKLAAVAGLDPAFRLTMVAPSRDAGRGSQAAAMLQRYLTGPALVPRERLLFCVADFARPGQLELILARAQESR
jgi:hypothetical protein